GLARAHPRLWSTLYHCSDVLNPQLLLGPFLKRGFARQIAESRPDIVVSVLPVVNGLLAAAAAANGARMEVVLTDWHAVHRFWVAPGVDHYTAPTDSARLDCIRFGAAPATVEIVGVPVRREFGVPQERAVARASLSAVGLRRD